MVRIIAASFFEAWRHVPWFGGEPIQFLNVFLGSTRAHFGLSKPIRHHFQRLTWDPLGYSMDSHFRRHCRLCGHVAKWEVVTEESITSISRISVSCLVATAIIGGLKGFFFPDFTISAHSTGAPQERQRPLPLVSANISSHAISPPR